MLPKKYKFILILILCAVVFISTLTLNTTGMHSQLAAEPTRPWNIAKFIF
ncbi:hypothetical protein CLROS_001910 [Clostridium felsineum]|uniref:Uncharacterized protein n=1 Tax=Clostridium felsineum TaxID=36839 RepID=A0A1S8LPG6_9CLOT|nr:hypothetical protein CLROS_001910 [Clostridium felsineum]URZ09908.1 hypothetical protein CROST_006160 [Clostridium felsineum]